MRRATIPMTLAGAAFILAGGWVHVREWIDGYRSVPADVPGAAVVRLGFPLNGVVSVAVVVAILLTVRGARRSRVAVLAGAAAFQVTSLAAVVLSRESSFLGWTEPTWTTGAQQSAAVAAGALLTVAAAIAVLLLQPAPAAKLPRATASATAPRSRP